MADRFQSTLPLRGATRHVRNQQAHRAISIHTPLAGSDQAQDDDDGADGISIHTPLAGSDSCAAEVSARSEISIHTPLAGSDFTSMRLLGNRKNDFNPHSPCGERLRFSTKTIGRNYFNPHSPCGERPGDCAEQFIELVISIHTPLAGSDDRTRHHPNIPYYFNPHSPCGERQRRSARSMRANNFNPHSPCGERPQK